MNAAITYNTQLQAGLGLIDETRHLLQLWEPGMSAGRLFSSALHAGEFSGMSARRLQNVIRECFAPRYLSGLKPVAPALQAAMPVLAPADFEQLLFLYTARANPILADFIREVYWPKYAQGYTSISNGDARDFVLKANQQGKTQVAWSESTLRRVSSYLTGACADFRLLERGTRSHRRILGFRPSDAASIWLAYDLHFQDIGDNALIQHPDWALFGYTAEEVRQELRRLSLKGFFIVQSATHTIHLSWHYENWEKLIYGLAERQL